MFFPPPFLCHCCNCEVQAKEDCWSCSSESSLIEVQLYKVNLHILNINANTWLQNPTSPATKEQQALLTSPVTIHRQIFRLCGGSVFLKLWQHLPLKKKCFESLAHSISSRYSSSRKKNLAFIKPVGTVWWSLLAIAFPDLITKLFISTLVNIGIFSSEDPQPVLGNSTDSSPSLLRSVLVFCFSFRRLYILCGSGFTISLSLPVLMYSSFAVSPRHFSQNLSSEFDSSSGFRQGGKHREYHSQ